MFSIAKFFERIQNVHSKELFVRTQIQAAIKNSISVEIPLASITFKSSTIELKNVSQSLRSAIFIKKNAILKAVNEAQTIREVTDIR